jgi:SAM-dependent methyltransferase
VTHLPLTTIAPDLSASVNCCSNCGFVFYSFSTNPDSFYKRYYLTSAKYDEDTLQAGSGRVSWDRERLTEALDYLESAIRLRKTDLIADIGCGGGGMLALLAERGYENLVGLDVQSNLSLSIDKRIGFRPFDLCEEHLDPPPIAPKVILLSHVLEHIYDLDRAVRNIKLLVGADTYVYIEVPDCDRYLEYYKTPFHYFSEEHINHFNFRTLRFLFEKHGFVKVDNSLHSCRKDYIKVSSRETYPVAWGIFKLDKRMSIDSYIERSQYEMGSLNVALSELSEDGTPLVLWGIGSTMRRIWSSRELITKTNPVSLVDSSPKLIGTDFFGYTIRPPESLGDFSGVILITVSIFIEEIKETIFRVAPKAKVLSIGELLKRG